MHEGHRERLREKFRKNGVDGLAEHEMLELLLFNSIPRANTNDAAHRLLDRFGSVSAVLDADESALTEVQGIGPRSAHLIKLINAFTRINLQQRCDMGDILDTPEKSGNYILPYYVGAVNEIFYVITLDNRRKVIGCHKLCEGSPGNVGISVRGVIEAAIKDNAAAIILCHNHPGGFALPSDDDIATTSLIVTAMRGINVRVNDHIIIGCDGDFVSMCSSSQYRSTFKF